ncbi:MAG: T9SS type A sorting domain-containing protein [Flavobacteriales bacterium]|nr:T9SS type A sorting domain-containing protein [Flavobacteriales bacterium]
MRKPLFLSLAIAFAAVFLLAFRYQPEKQFKKRSFDHRSLINDTLFEGNNSFFASSGVCDNCHGFDPNGIASTDLEGGDVNVVDDWRSSMMANSARDPFWRAKVSHEVFVNPAHQVELESTCTRCHAPMGNYAASINGAEHYSMAEMLLDSVALDGVSCLACHQQSPYMPFGHSGFMHFSSAAIAYGPYEDPLVTPMFLGSGYLPEYGAHMSQSELCGTCHSLITSTVDLEGNPTGEEFVEQATWHEWLNSAYPQMETSCQDCHMPTLGDQGIILAKGSDTPPRSPFSLHSFSGGNAFMLGVLRDNVENLSLTASPEQFESSRLAAVQNLQQNSLQMMFTEEERNEDTLSLELLLTNIAGHKLPSGYPSRRMVVQVTMYDSLGQELWSSGNFDDEFYVIGQDSPYEPHHQVIRDEDEVQIYEMVMGDVNGNMTTLLERGDSHLKDNRLVPLGFSYSNEMYDTTEVVLGITDPDFNYNPNEGSGTDKIRYHIPLNGYSGSLNVSASVYFQSIPPVWLEEMFATETPEINEFQAMYDEADKTPVLMKIANLEITEYVSLDDSKIRPSLVSSYLRGNELVIQAKKILTIELYDASGRLVLKEKVLAGNNVIQLNMARGTYVAVYSSSTQNQIHKFVLTR